MIVLTSNEMKLPIASHSFLALHRKLQGGGKGPRRREEEKKISSYEIVRLKRSFDGIRGRERDTVEFIL